MKRTISILLTLFLLFAFSSCSSDKSDGAADSEERTELILATDISSAGFNSIISSFNKNSERYIVKSVHYGSQDNTIDQLRTEIIAGNPPDIYAFSQNWFADVNVPIYDNLLPYLDSDPVYNRETFVPSLFNAIICDDSLYYIPCDFYIDTFAARESVVGVRSGITAEEAEKFAKDMGADITVFPAWMSRENLLTYAVKFSIAKFIDSDADKCDFLDQEFIEILEQCKAHPFSPPDDLSAPSLMSNYPLQSFVIFIGLHNKYGTDYSFVGFPTQDSNGSTFGINMRLSISAASAHKDAAWEFVRMVMSEEIQKDVDYFPSVQSELDRQIEIVLEGDPNITPVKLEQFEVDRFNNLINSTTMVSDGTDTVIYTIIAEEAAAFFAGAKTAEDVSQIIQSRVSLVLSERG